MSSRCKGLDKSLCRLVSFHFLKSLVNFFNQTAICKKTWKENEKKIEKRLEKNLKNNFQKSKKIKEIFKRFCKKKNCKKICPKRLAYLVSKSTQLWPCFQISRFYLITYLQLFYDVVLMVSFQRHVGLCFQLWKEYTLYRLIACIQITFTRYVDFLISIFSILFQRLIFDHTLFSSNPSIVVTWFISLLVIVLDVWLDQYHDIHDI